MQKGKGVAGEVPTHATILPGCGVVPHVISELSLLCCQDVLSGFLRRYEADGPELEHFILQSACSDVNRCDDGLRLWIVTVSVPYSHPVVLTILQENGSGIWEWGSRLDSLGC